MSATSRSEWKEAPNVRAELGIFAHEGKEYASRGAFVSPTHLVCYPHADGTVRAWDDSILGAYKVVSTRRAVFFGRDSWQGSRYYFMRAMVNGQTYAIRGFGPGMLARGKAVKS